MERPDRISEALRSAQERKQTSRYIDYAVSRGASLEARKAPAQVVALDSRRGQGPTRGF